MQCIVYVFTTRCCFRIPYLRLFLPCAFIAWTNTWKKPASRCIDTVKTYKKINYDTLYIV